MDEKVIKNIFLLSCVLKEIEEKNNVDYESINEKCLKKYKKFIKINKK